MKLTTFIRYNYRTIIWSLVILVLSWVPGKSIPEFSFWSLLSFDKFAHAAVYAILVLVTIVGQSKQYRFSFYRSKIVIRSLIFSTVYGIGVEIFQAYSNTGRHMEFADMIANTIGGLLGVAIFYIIYGKAVHARVED